MKRLPLIFWLCIAPLFANEAKIGVYDSRSVAIAFAGSGPFEKWMAPLYAELKKAKAADEYNEISDLQREGVLRQKKLHTQAFNGTPVFDILNHIKDKLPAIKKKAGVTVLVSKWNQDELARHKGAKKIDVTMPLVDAFEPSKKQRKRALDIQKKEPLPIKE